MKIKNTSSRIVHIGTTTILPDEVETVDDSLKNSPVVSMFVERGELQIVTEKAVRKAGKGAKKAPDKAADTGDTPGDKEAQEGSVEGDGDTDGDKGDSEVQ